MIDFTFLKDITAEQYYFGGFAMVCFCLILVLWKISKLYFNHTTEIIERNTNAWIENTKVNQRLADVVEHLDKHK